MMKRDATFSPCETYRYQLHREWHQGLPTVLFVMLNPSTADANVDDNTIQRCIGYGMQWGYGRLLVGNLFGLRSTDPDNLKTVEDPVGPDNDRHLIEMAGQADLVVAAWGVDGGLMDRGKEVLSLLDVDWHALTVTKDGYPGHPLYLKKSLVPFPYTTG